MRKKILEMLKSAGGEFLSGENIAGTLNITRSAVWKHIRALKKNGYEIDGREKRGYVLKDVTNLLFPEEICDGLKTSVVGAKKSKFYYYPVIDSTNEKAKELARKGAPDGAVVVAEEQTGGKGRLERKFFSPKGKGIFFSLILRPKILPKDAPKFTLMAAAAVAEAMKRFDLRPEIKWPNDLMFDGRKIVGILTEMSGEISAVNHIVVGIGINVNVKREEFPRDIRKVAASLAEVAGKEISRPDFFRALLEELDKIYCEVCKNGFGEVWRIWRENNITLGKKINVVAADTGETFSGVAVDVDADGALIVETDGERRTVYAGDVSIR